MLSQNMAPRHIEYFLRWRGLRKLQKQEGLSDLPPTPLFSPTVHRSSCEKCPPYTQRKGASISPEWKNMKRKPREQVSPSLPSLLHLAHALCLIVSFHDFQLFIKSIKTLSGVTISSGLHFLIKAPMSHKTLWKKFVCLSLLNPSFSQGPQPKTTQNSKRIYLSLANWNNENDSEKQVQ